MVEGGVVAGAEGVEAASEPYIGTILENIRDENETFRELLMPLYHAMVKIFQDKLWLAEPDTREYFPRLVEFVYVWDRVLDSRLPRAIAPAIGHTRRFTRMWNK